MREIPPLIGIRSPLRARRADDLLRDRDVGRLAVKHTGQSKEQIHEDIERDKFFQPPAAVEYGLIDRVIESHEFQAAPVGASNGSS
jgi:ATP-dependent Clp protease, protease subunit